MVTLVILAFVDTGLASQLSAIVLGLGLTHSKSRVQA
jgi:hypothetical protein